MGIRHDDVIVQAYTSVPPTQRAVALDNTIFSGHILKGQRSYHCERVRVVARYAQFVAGLNVALVEERLSWGSLSVISRFVR